MDQRPQQYSLPLATTLASGLLAPLLLAQGLYVRAVTPRLPEAEGARRGESGEGPLLRLLVTGDSAAAGVGVAMQDDALTGQLVRRLSSTHRVRWELVAATGYRSADLLERLGAMGGTEFDAALVSVGVNDVTGLTSTARWRGNLNVLIALLKARFGVRHIILSELPPIHLFPALPQPLRWALGSRATWLSRVMAEVAGVDPAVSYLVTTLNTGSDVMASDGFHPGAPVYSAWAEAAARRALERT